MLNRRLKFPFRHDGFWNVNKFSLFPKFACSVTTIYIFIPLKLHCMHQAAVPVFVIHHLQFIEKGSRKFVFVTKKRCDADEYMLFKHMSTNRLGIHRGMVLYILLFVHVRHWREKRRMIKIIYENLWWYKVLYGQRIENNTHLSCAYTKHIFYMRKKNQMLPLKHMAPYIRVHANIPFLRFFNVTFYTKWQETFFIYVHKRAVVQNNCDPYFFNKKWGYLKNILLYIWSVVYVIRKEQIGCGGRWIDIIKI